MFGWGMTSRSTMEKIELLFNKLDELDSKLKEDSSIVLPLKVISELFDEFVQLKPGDSAIDELPFALIEKRISHFLKEFSDIFANIAFTLPRELKYRSLLYYQLAGETRSFKLFSSYDLKLLSQIASKVSRCTINNEPAEIIVSKVAAITAYRNIFVQKKRLRSIILMVRIYIVFTRY